LSGFNKITNNFNLTGLMLVCMQLRRFF